MKNITNMKKENKITPLTEDELMERLHLEEKEADRQFEIDYQRLFEDGIK